MGVEVKRFEVYLVRLDPTVGREIRKSRPCVVISPDEMNDFIGTVIVAPMTTKRREYPTRISCRFAGKPAEIVLDQIRTIDKTRLTKRLGRIDSRVQERVVAGLLEMFAP
jgi:mRNA interferase MazF